MEERPVAVVAPNPFDMVTTLLIRPPASPLIARSAPAAGEVMGSTLPLEGALAAALLPVFVAASALRLPGLLAIKFAKLIRR
jgi:hypothetical protein